MLQPATRVYHVPSNPNRPSNAESPRRSEPANAALHISPISDRGSSTRPNRPSPGSSRGPIGGGGGAGFGLAVPVGGSGGASGGVGAQRNVGSPSGRKRGLLEDECAAGGINQPEDGGRRDFNCSLCNRAFGSPKALFGHMCAHPPPRFRADEEFADLWVGEAAAEPAPAPALEGNFWVPDATIRFQIIY